MTLPKNSSSVEYYEAKQAKREAKEQRLRRQQERAERLAAQEATLTAHLQRKAAERLAAELAASNSGYAYSTRHYTAPPVQEKPQEFPERSDRTRKQHEYMRMVGAPNSNGRRRIGMRIAEPMDLDFITQDFGNKGFGKIKGLQITTRWSSSHV